MTDGQARDRAEAAAELEVLLQRTRRRRLRGLLVRGTLLAAVTSVLLLGAALVAGRVYAGATLTQARTAWAVAAERAAAPEQARLVRTVAELERGFAVEAPAAWLPAGIHARLDLAATYRLARAALVRTGVDDADEPSSLYPTAHRLWSALQAGG